MAVNHLLNGRDVMAILPTGFGKSMIFTVFALAKQELSSTKTSVLVISPLKSIIDVQISEMLSLNFTAMELSSETIDLVRDNPPQFLYCSAEAALEKPFLAMLKGDSELHRAVSAIVVDESHSPRCCEKILFYPKDFLIYFYSLSVFLFSTVQRCADCNAVRQTR